MNGKLWVIGGCLNTIHENYEYIPLCSNYILQLHRDLYWYSEKGIGGSFKNTQNYISATDRLGNTFILLSDPELAAIQAYGVWREKKLYGKVSMGVVRSTFIIDENGMIEKVMPKVKPDTNAADALAYLSGE